MREASLHGGTVVNEAKQFLETQKVEIEGRLGRVTSNGEFSSNVGADSFCSVLHLLESYKKWDRIEDWRDIHDIFYTIALSTGIDKGDFPRNVQVRTTVGVQNNGHAVTNILKHKIKQADFALRGEDSMSCALAAENTNLIDPVNARISASVETELTQDLIPVAVVSDLVRIKQRKTFYLKSEGIDEATFAFDVTIVFTGKTKTEAEEAQKSNINPSFEIEIECLQPQKYLEMCDGDGFCLAMSILAKLLDFASHLNHGRMVTYIPRGPRTTSAYSTWAFPNTEKNGLEMSNF